MVKFAPEPDMVGTQANRVFQLQNTLDSSNDYASLNGQKLCCLSGVIKKANKHIRQLWYPLGVLKQNISVVLFILCFSMTFYDIIYVTYHQLYNVKLMANFYGQFFLSIVTFNLWKYKVKLIACKQFHRGPDKTKKIQRQ